MSTSGKLKIESRDSGLYVVNFLHLHIAPILIYLLGTVADW